MSTTTIPFQNRTGFFPGADSASRTLITSDFDYIDLTAIDSDGGLREAYRIWWFLEQLSFVPSGTVTLSPASQTFSRTFRAPDSIDVASSFPDGYVSGSIVGTISQLSLSTSTLQPALRGGAINSVGQVFADVLQYDQGYEISVNESEDARVRLIVINMSGQWRLYYRFYFIINARRSSPIGTGSLTIANPALSEATPIISTGTVEVAGYDLNWEAYVSGPSGTTGSGAGLSCTTTEWTF
jgi:hypothetical protein